MSGQPVEALGGVALSLQHLLKSDLMRLMIEVLALQPSAICKLVLLVMEGHSTSTVSGASQKAFMQTTWLSFQASSLSGLRPCSVSGSRIFWLPQVSRTTPV